MDTLVVSDAFKAAWTANPELHESLVQVTQQPEHAPSPTAPGMLSVAGHFEFRDGARFKLRYSYDPKKNPQDQDDSSGSFLSVEDDVGLHFGFLDDINAFLLDLDVGTSAPATVMAKALVKAVKMHTRAAATSSKTADANHAGATNGNGNGNRINGYNQQGIAYPNKPSGKSAAYRIEDHPLAAMLAAQQPNARHQRRQLNVDAGENPHLNADAIALAPPRVIFPGHNHPANVPPPDAGAVGQLMGAAPLGANGNAAGGAGAAGAAGAANAGAENADNAGASGGERKRGGSAQMDFGSSRMATNALMQQLRILEKQNTRAEGFSATPQGDDLYTWDIKLFFDDTSTALARDLNNLPGIDCLKLEFKFPSSFPHEPPVVRFISPVINGGHVTLHGAICMELLTAAGWTPCNSVDAVCVQIRALLISGNARIDLARPNGTERYTLNGALKDLSAIVFSHGWTVDNGRVAKVKRPRNDSVGPNR